MPSVLLEGLRPTLGVGGGWMWPKNPSSRTDLNLTHLQPQADSELEKRLLPGTLHKVLPCVLGALNSALLLLTSCVSSGKLLNLSESHFPQNTNWGFHSQWFIPSKNLICWVETQESLSCQQRHRTELVLKSKMDVTLPSPPTKTVSSKFWQF